MSRAKSRRRHRPRGAQNSKGKPPSRDGHQPSAAISVQFPRTRHSATGDLIVVPQFPAGDPRSALITNEGSPGRYAVRFVLSRPGQETHVENLNLEQFSSSGDSLLRLPAGSNALQSTVRHDNGTYDVRFELNARGALAAAELQLEALSLFDAERQAYDAVQGLLSFLSFQHDVALDTRGWIVVELATGTLRFHAGFVGEEQQVLSTQVGATKPEHQALVASYRQGTNATNLFFALLSYWRVIEGVKRLRDARRPQLLAEGRKPDPVEQMPTDLLSLVPAVEPWLSQSFQPYLGKKFTAVTESLRDTLRNALAHIDPKKTVASGDRYDDMRRAELALPVVRYMARHMLEAELATYGDESSRP